MRQSPKKREQFLGPRDTNPGCSFWVVETRPKNLSPIKHKLSLPIKLTNLKKEVSSNVCVDDCIMRSRKRLHEEAAGWNKISNCNIGLSTCTDRLSKASKRFPRCSFVANPSCVEYIDEPICNDCCKIVEWQPSFTNYPANPNQSSKCRFQKPWTSRDERVVSCICRPKIMSTMPCRTYSKSGCTNVLPQCCVTEPSVVVKCGKICSAKGDGEDKTTLFLCEKQISPVRMTDCDNIIGTFDDIQSETCCNYTICPSDVVSDTNCDFDFCEKVVNQSNGRSVRVGNCDAKEGCVLPDSLVVILLPLLWTLKVAFVLIMFAVYYLALLIFMNFNNLAHIFSMFLFLLLLFILVVAPDNVLVYQYMM